jgi:hypothetical protein
MRKRAEPPPALVDSSHRSGGDSASSSNAREILHVGRSLLRPRCDRDESSTAGVVRGFRSFDRFDALGRLPLVAVRSKIRSKSLRHVAPWSSDASLDAVGAHAGHKVPHALALQLGFKFDEGVAQPANGGVAVLAYVPGLQEPGVGEG